MRTRTPYRALLIAVAAAMPALTMAQPTATTIQGRSEAEHRRVARADTLDQRAEALHQIPRNWREAARLHRRAGELRGDHASSIRSFRLAAWLYIATNGPGPARTMMEKAAESATAIGDLEQGATAYIDAALIASADDYRRVPKLLERARLLIDSPLFPAESRVALTQRIQGATELAQLWKPFN